ncbi:extracellular solute-binding protein [Paenibacillus barcinonensis]|uniref:Extracellular solute-binding protein n=1 Tax=Paenibacillus barcinonensis TaxID=198119 RepID=A0A2V4VL59_PAEBA|nr:extracellular solute-binding protein [Paenibacillus barcinonensis]PYE45630.1 raffinose/stachyose/melibiose transport system substrate-binding protein [Paenibacillus barcinonensis]QKS56184.1 extracellular solute-binding protein [Paenibacillus barcinonensis]
MKNRKRLWALTLVLLMTFLSACSSSGQEQSNADNNGGGNNDSAKPITLTMMLSGNKASEGEDFDLETLPRLVKEKFPNITLEVQKLPDDQYNTSVRTKLAAGQGPDIFWIFPKNAAGGVIDFAKAGFAADLSDLKFWDNISEGAKNDMSFEGKPYGVARGLDFLGVYYNKELLQQAGYSEFPKDWSSFLELCQKLKDAGITPIAMGDKDPWVIQFGMYQIAANMVYPNDMDFDVKLQKGETSLTDAKWVQTISKYKELYDKNYVVKNSLGIGSAQSAQLFIDGKAAMTFTGTWDYASMTSKGAADFTRGFASLPGNDAGKPVYVSAATSAGYALNAKSANLDAAKQVLNYLFDGQSELFKAFVASNSSINVYKGVTLENELFKEVNDNYQQTGNSVYFSNQMWPAGVSDVMQAKFAEIIAGQKTTPEQVADAMESKFRELWKN